MSNLFKIPDKDGCIYNFQTFGCFNYNGQEYSVGYNDEHSFIPDNYIIFKSTDEGLIKVDYSMKKELLHVLVTTPDLLRKIIFHNLF